METITDEVKVGTEVDNISEEKPRRETVGEFLTVVNSINGPSCHEGTHKLCK